MQIPYRKPGKYANESLDPLLTQEKFDELTKQLERLIKSRKTVAKEVARLAEFGDFSENVEYQLAKGRLRGINNRILVLEHQLNQAQIISPEKANTVQIGNTVTIHDGDKQKTYQILGSTEADPTKGIISYTSPIGSALLGKKLGDTATIELPGKTMDYTIVNIE